jgi:hypothetical protein
VAIALPAAITSFTISGADAGGTAKPSEVTVPLAPGTTFSGGGGAT